MAQASATLAAYAYISGTWTLLDDIQPARFSWGMAGNRPTDRVADTGELTFSLNNSAGLYTPGGPSALSGWRKGVPVKLVVTYESEQYVRFRGIVDDVDIHPNNKDKRAYVTVLDWLDYAARHPIINPGIDTDQRGDEVLDWVVSNIEIPPRQVDFDEGIETFPTVFDTTTSRTRAYNEFVKVAFSELGYVYRRSDKTDGETIRFESADARHGWREAGEIPIANADSPGYLLREDGSYVLREDGGKIILNHTASKTFGASSGVTIEDFSAPYGDHVINRLTVTANPRRLDASPVALFSLDQEIVITSAQTYTLKGTYADPNGGLPVNGQDMVTPVATTDYTMFTATSGGGSNITGSLTVSITYGTEGFTATLTNTNSATGYVNFFRTRGTGIYVYNPIQHSATNSDSIGEFDVVSDSVNQKYKNDTFSGAAWAESQVEEYREPRVVLNSISFTANSSPAHMMSFLHTDIGDLRYVEISELGITGNYYIQGIRCEMNGGIIRVTWLVLAVLSLLTDCGLAALAVEFNGTGSTDTVDFGVQPMVFSDDTGNEITICTWIYLDDISGSRDILNFSTNGGGIRFWVSTSPSGALKVYSNIFNTTPGEWQTAGSVISIGAWIHVAYTYDFSSATNDPVVYKNGVSQSISENLTPSGTPYPRSTVPIMVGNRKTATEDYDRPFDGKIFDARVYNRILSSTELTTLYNSGTPDETLLTDPSTGLVFQAFAVRTGELADYVDDTLTSTTLVRDAVFGAVGVPHGSPIGRAAP